MKRKSGKVSPKATPVLKLRPSFLGEQLTPEEIEDLRQDKKAKSAYAMKAFARMKPKS